MTSTIRRSCKTFALYNNYPSTPIIVQEILIHITNLILDSYRTRPLRAAIIKYHRKVKCYEPRGIKNMPVLLCGNKDRGS